jgi:hypothetical protein
MYELLIQFETKMDEIITSMKKYTTIPNRSNAGIL